jgi:hypothetical protein
MQQRQIEMLERLLREAREVASERTGGPAQNG